VVCEQLCPAWGTKQLALPQQKMKRQMQGLFLHAYANVIANYAGYLLEETMKCSICNYEYNYAEYSKSFVKYQAN
jgi:hypothetical protein